MSNIQMKITINNQEYSMEQLDWIKYERNKHVLHEMKALGADISDDGKALSHEDINYLSMPDAERICIDARKSLGMDGIRNLYKKQLLRSDEMWKEFAKDFKEGDALQEGYTYIEAKGITMQQLQQILASDDEETGIGYLSNPEHFFVSATENGPHGMEPMGMFGEPTEFQVISDPTMTPPVPRNADYPMAVIGKTRLANDETDIHVYAMPQLKPTEDGVNLILGIYLPPKAPKELLFGHQIHLAIEFAEMIKFVAKNN